MRAPIDDEAKVSACTCAIAVTLNLFCTTIRSINDADNSRCARMLAGITTVVSLTNNAISARVAADNSISEADNKLSVTNAALFAAFKSQRATDAAILASPRTLVLAIILVCAAETALIELV